MRSLSESSFAYKAVVFILNNKVNWFLARLHSINMQKVGVKGKAALHGTIFAYDYRARLAYVMTSLQIVLC